MTEPKKTKSLSMLGGASAQPKPSTAPTAHLTRQQKEDAEAEERALIAQKQYGRGKPVNTKRIKDVKTRRQLTALEGKYKQAAVRAKEAEILHEHDAGLIEVEGDLERTWKVRQSDIKDAVGVETAKKGFELKLDGMGPYKARYTRNGRNLLLAGKKGHIATMEWRDGKLGCEMQLGEHVRDAIWLHNSNSFAVAQARKVYIYDHTGMELHQLDAHTDPLFLEFLPYHFLLASLGNHGWLKYMDTSTGQFVAEMSTKKGTPTALAQNPYNAILHTGHQNGTVQLWSPNSPTPLVKILAHRGPVRSIGTDREGRYMVTAGSDQRMSVWDIRAFKPMQTYALHQPGTSVAVSDRNLTAIGWGTQTTVWRGLFDRAKEDQETRTGSPYLQWGGAAQRIESLSWCPFEDVLGVGHSQGFSSALVPGAGEPNFDALEANPYETVKQRQEAEVHSLLHKLQPGMISLDPHFIGNLDVRSHEQRVKEKDLDRKEEDPVERARMRGRGRNSGLRKMLRKEKSRNIVDEKRARLEELMKRRDVREGERMKKQGEQFGPALARFARKGGG
jgi:U3 small nucleolar RNA-associated protein 7